MRPKNDVTLESLAAEVAALRRSRRRDRALLLVAGLAIGAAATAGAAPTPGALEVRSLLLRDDAGNARAKLAMGEGGPRLSFADATGHARFVLGEDRGDNPFLALADGKGVVRVWMTIEPFGPSLNMKDASGLVRASLTVAAATEASNEGPRWALLDVKGNSRVVLGANDAESGIRVGGGPGPGNGALRWADGGPHLDLTGADGKPLFHAP